MYHLADFSRKKGSRDKQKRKSRKLAALALGGLGLAGATYLGVKGIKRYQTVKRLNTPLGKSSHLDTADPKDDLGFRFMQEAKKRSNLKKDKDLKRMMDHWDNNQAEGNLVPRKPYSDGFGGKLGSVKDKFLNSPYGKAVLLGGAFGLISRTKDSERNKNPVERYKRIGVNNIPMWAGAGGAIGGYIGMGKRQDLVKSVLKGMAVGGTFGIARTLSHGTRDSLLRVAPKKKKKEITTRV